MVVVGESPLLLQTGLRINPWLVVSCPAEVLTLTVCSAPAHTWDRMERHGDRVSHG